MGSNINQHTRKAVFLDRDGVVNELVYHPDEGIVDSPFTVPQFRLLPGIGEAIEMLRGMGYCVVLASNQPGIAKGHMTRETFDKISARMRDELDGQGCRLDGEYYCFHHPEARFEQLRASCECRKPKPGLLIQAARELDIDLSRSWMVGDGLTDVQAGKKAGCRTILMGRMKCELCRIMDQEDARPDAICAQALDIPRIIELNGG